MLLSIHHTAIICSDYERSKRFYVNTLGLRVVDENFRSDRNSWKLDLALPDGAQIELFTFPGAPKRPAGPEQIGLRHLAFAVTNVDRSKAILEARRVEVEPVRIDEYTGRKFTFFRDPDGIALEIYEAS